MSIFFARSNTQASGRLQYIAITRAVPFSLKYSAIRWAFDPAPDAKTTSCFISDILYLKLKKVKSIIFSKKSHIFAI
jgi:hypothetical protein